MSGIGNDNVVSALEKARMALDDAVTNVAQSAQMVADGAEPFHKGLESECFIVDREDMEELKESLKVWKQVTQDFLSAVKGSGG